MPNPLVDIIDDEANRTLSGLMMAAQAIEGSYSQNYRNSPTLRGLSLFLTESENTPAIAAQFVVDGLQSLEARLREFGVLINLDNVDIAYQAHYALFQQLRYVAARRYRAAVVSRSSVAPALSGSMKLMNRAGQSFNAREMLFLSSRKALLDATNEAIIERLTRLGRTVAEVRHVDEEHPIDGATILITPGISGMPTYADVVEKWFHPRAAATLNWS